MISDPSKLYHSLELEHKAIVLSVYAPYDTVQLWATPKNLKGEAIEHHGTLQFRRLNELDTAVRVDPDGLLHAQLPTSATKIIVSLTIDGITQADTATIMVRNESPVRKITRLEFFPLPPDSSWRWAAWRAAIGYEKWVRLFGVNDTTIPATQAVINYTWNNDDVVSTPADRLYESAWGVVGESYIHASVYAYGTALSDSVLFRRVDPTVKFVLVDRIVPAHSDPSIVFFPGTLEIRPGTTVIFFNSRGFSYRSLDICTVSLDYCGNRIINRQVFPEGYQLVWVDSVDIKFDRPENVLAGDSYGPLEYRTGSRAFPSDLGVGNIDAFSIVLCETLPDAYRACGNATSELRDPGYRSRKFVVPGIYRYTSSRFPGASGTIIVKE